jgi:hypothetical protein
VDERRQPTDAEPSARRLALAQTTRHSLASDVDSGRQAKQRRVAPTATGAGSAGRMEGSSESPLSAGYADATKLLANIDPPAHSGSRRLSNPRLPEAR